MSGWTLDIQNMSWVEHTLQEVDFVIQALHLRGNERILDLACGFGRHSLDLARRGYSVDAVDITPEYVQEGRRRAATDGLDVTFVQSDVLRVSFQEEFDVVLNLADGAIGYFETEADNMKLFDIIASALVVGGKHLLGICNAAHAQKYFPRRHWEAGTRSISLADFQWNAATSRMLYTSHVLNFGRKLTPLKEEGTGHGIRLYTVEELADILGARDLTIRGCYGGYDTAIPASEDDLTLLVYSEKEERSAQPSAGGDAEARTPQP